MESLDQVTDILEADTQLYRLILTFTESMSLKAALRLQIADVIDRHGGPMTLSQLAATIPIHPSKIPHFHRLMRLLTSSQIFVKVKIDAVEDGYWHSPVSRLLVKTSEISCTSFAIMLLDRVLVNSFHWIGEWFQSDLRSPCFMEHDGKTFWELAGVNPHYNTLFNEAMGNDATLMGEVLTKKYRHIFEGFNTMLDVGGGTGTLAKAIAQEFPQAKFIVLDLPHVVATAENSENVTFVAGDMFDSVPQADAITLKLILHDWDDEQCVKILRNCREALVSNNGGKVIILDMVVDENSPEKTQLYADMQMMVCAEGKERTEKEWAGLFSAAGFSNYKITRLSTIRSIIEVFP